MTGINKKPIGYHIAPIKKGILGELSKVKEELEEALDADDQLCHLMVLIELADVIGAVDAYLMKHHPTVTLEDLIKFHQITKRAFESGCRK